jgi:hypothetical protein
VERAGEHGVDAGTAVGEQGLDPLLDGQELVPAEQTAADPGLVGDDDDRDGERVGPGEYLRRALDQADVPGPAEMPDFFDDGAVAIEEQRRAWRPSGRELGATDPDAVVAVDALPRRSRAQRTNLRNSGFRFSLKACTPSCDSAVP